MGERKLRTRVTLEAAQPTHGPVQTAIDVTRGAEVRTKAHGLLCRARGRRLCACAAADRGNNDSEQQPSSEVLFHGFFPRELTTYCKQLET